MQLSITGVLTDAPRSAAETAQARTELQARIQKTLDNVTKAVTGHPRADGAVHIMAPRSAGKKKVQSCSTLH